MQNCIDPVTARRLHAETATYCWKHSGHETVHQSFQGNAGLRTANNNRMSGTHLHDGSSRASTTIRHPQDASDTHCLYRHPQDASNDADNSSGGKSSRTTCLTVIPTPKLNRVLTTCGAGKKNKNGE